MKTFYTLDADFDLSWIKVSGTAFDRHKYHIPFESSDGNTNFKLWDKWIYSKDTHEGIWFEDIDTMKLVLINKIKNIKNEK